ncbi:MAG TPA: serine hydrolase domain-containing protein [Solirubrobacterales bacterium]|nr:serine hydrolase domain-containing protein [Solirubrobacterales bacterium]
MKAVVIAACCAIAVAVAVPAATSAAKPRLQRSLDAIVKMPGGPPGIAAIVERGDRREFFAAGVAEVGTGRAPTARDHLRIASVSKGFNSLLAVLLERDGALRLSDRLGERIPGVLPQAEEVTVRQLLQHTGGVPDYIRSPAFIDWFLADPTAYIAPRQLTAFVATTPLQFPPGTRYHYSDTDNIAAALIQARVSNRPYERLLATRVFRPLRMRSSSLPRTTRMPRPFLHGYEIEAGERPEDVSEAINPSGAWASGGIVSTLGDLTRFAGFYVPTVLRRTRGIEGGFRPGASSPPGPGRNSAGLGIFRYRLSCGTVYGHTGSFPGYRILLAADADGERSVAFVANAQIVPGQGSPKVAKAITRAQKRAVCRALG